jgi:hypothetical protein
MIAMYWICLSISGFICLLAAIEDGCGCGGKPTPKVLPSLTEGERSDPSERERDNRSQNWAI